MHLIAKFAASQNAFFAKTQKPGEIVGRLALVQLAPHPSPVNFIVERFQNVNLDRAAHSLQLACAGVMVAPAEGPLEKPQWRQRALQRLVRISVSPTMSIMSLRRLRPPTPAEHPPRRFSNSDRGASLHLHVDLAVDPFAAHLHVSVVHTPGAADRADVSFPPLLKLGTVTLHPSQNRRMREVIPRFFVMATRSR